MALRLATVGADPAFVAELLAKVSEIQEHGIGAFLIWDDRRDRSRHFYALGEVDPDGAAGYAARCFAAMANEA